MKEINLENGMPTVSQALDILRHELKSCKSQKRKCIKLIHGYGSSGKGGKIRTSARKFLASDELSIKFVIHGENFSIFDENTRKAFSFCNQLRQDRDLDNHNSGVTFIIL